MMTGMACLNSEVAQAIRSHRSMSCAFFLASRGQERLQCAAVLFPMAALVLTPCPAADKPSKFGFACIQRPVSQGSKSQPEFSAVLVCLYACQALKLPHGCRHANGGVCRVFPVKRTQFHRARRRSDA